MAIDGRGAHRGGLDTAAGKSTLGHCDAHRHSIRSRYRTKPLGIAKVSRRILRCLGRGIGQTSTKEVWAEIKRERRDHFVTTLSAQCRDSIVEVGLGMYSGISAVTNRSISAMISITRRENAKISDGHRRRARFHALGNRQRQPSRSGY